MMNNETCQRLQNNIPDFAEGCKKLVVEINNKKCGCLSDEENAIRISQCLAKIGKNVRTVRFNAINEECLNEIKYFCPNVTKIELDADMPIFSSTDFPKLNAMEFFGDKLCVKKWLDEMKSAPAITSLVLPYNKDLMQPLSRLSNLKSLWLDNVPGSHCRELFYLQNLTHLTKLTIGSSSENSNELIGLLVAILGHKLLQLTLHIPYNANSFEKIKDFTRLEVLSIVHPGTAPELPESVFKNLSSKLKRIDLKDIIISLTTFWSLVYHLQYFEELVVRDITSVHDNTIGLNDSDFVDSLADRLQHRTLKINYSRRVLLLELHERNFNSGRLQIINRYFEPIPSESKFICSI